MMQVFPPRPKKKQKHTTKTQQNIHFLFVKQLGEYVPQHISQNKILEEFMTNGVSIKYKQKEKEKEKEKQDKKEREAEKQDRKEREDKKYRDRPASGSSCSSAQRLPMWRMTSIYRSTTITRQKLQKANLQSLQNTSPLPSISSKCYSLYSLSSERVLASRNASKRIEVASLTKIMNLYTINNILQTYELEPFRIRLPVSQIAANVIGTSACLQKYDLVSLEDLLYGMMLPSGNDAAYQIALIGGLILKLAQNNRVSKIYKTEEVENIVECRSNIIRYISEMNRLSKQELGMTNTNWVNVHGLSNKDNKTTVQDMCRLCQQVMKIQKCRKIVGCKSYRAEIESYFGGGQPEGQAYGRRSEGLEVEYGNKWQDNYICSDNHRKPKISKPHHILWQNTNKLLQKGWSGLKTGITPNAGPCLAATYTHSLTPTSTSTTASTASTTTSTNKNCNSNREVHKKVQMCQYLVILTNCQSMNRRWEEVQLLVNWAIQNQIY